MINHFILNKLYPLQSIQWLLVFTNIEKLNSSLFPKDNIIVHSVRAILASVSSTGVCFSCLYIEIRPFQFTFHILHKVLPDFLKSECKLPCPPKLHAILYKPLFEFYHIFTLYYDHLNILYQFSFNMKTGAVIHPYFHFLC